MSYDLRVMIFKKFLIWSLLFLILVFLLFQASLPAWFGHISTDTYVYFNRASYFYHNLNLANFKGNEHLPGAILLFIAASPVFLIEESLQSYIFGFTVINLVLILLIAYFILKVTSLKNIVILSLILLSIGPILFFRFDLLVVLLTIISFYFFQKEKYFSSIFVLACATLVKVYPVIFLPYLLLIVLKKNNLKTAVKLLTTYFVSILSLLIVYLFLFQISLENFQYSLNFHALKPVHTESIWATILTLISLIAKNLYPDLISAFGINGLSEKDWLLPLWFYNYIWFLPVGLFYVWIVKSKNILKTFDIRIPISILLIFLIFSKVLSHQYLLWFLLLIPLISYKKLTSSAWIINILLIILTNLLHQFVYPLNYSQFLFDYNSGNLGYLFWINALSNFILILLFIRIFWDIKT